MLRFFSEELLSANRYEPGFVVAMRDRAGIEEVKLYVDGIYKLELVGGGGGYGQNYSAVTSYFYFAGGGSAASFVGNVKLYAGEYQGVVGSRGENDYGNMSTGTHTGENGGNSVFQTVSGTAIITAGGGKGGKVTSGGGMTGGAAGTLNRHDNDTADEVAAKTGSGTKGNANIIPVQGISPVYSKYSDSYGRGAGYPSQTLGRDSTSGFFRLTFLRTGDLR